MSTYIGIGFSRDVDPARAAQEAAELALKSIHSSQFDIAVVLATAHYNPQDFIPQIYQSLRKTRLVGTSTAAILLNGRIETRGIGILLLYSDEVRFETGKVDNLHLQDLRAAGSQLAQSCMIDYGQEHRKLFMFFIDGTLKEISKFTEGVGAALHGSLPIVGAGGCDDFQLRKSYQFFNDSFFSFGACAVLWGGRLQAASSCRHGWRPLGKPRVIQQSEANFIKTIDHEPAIRIYQDYFPDSVGTLRASRFDQLNSRYPLGTPVARGEEYLLRNVLGTLEDDSIVLQDGIAEGKEVHLMIGNKESCLQAAQSAALEVKAQLQGRKPKLIFVFESLARYQILGRSATTELQHIREILGPDVPMFGMYSFGEASNIKNSASPDANRTLFQNESILITALC